MITETETKRNWLKFAGGFVGWFLVSTLIYAVALQGGVMLWIFYLPINILVMMILAISARTRWIGLGIVSAMAANFLIAAAMRPFLEAVCFFPVTYTSLPARVATQPAPANRSPIGYHDGSSGRVNQSDCVAFGWAVDPNNRDNDISVRVLADGNVISQKVASTYRSDLNVPDGCPGGTCGFLFNLWTSISHNEEHTIQVQAQDFETETWIRLSSTPKTLNCK